MASQVVHADLELFLIGWYRVALAARSEAFCQGVVVDRLEPAPGDPLPERMLIVRFDGSTRTSVVTEEATVGLSILAGTKVAPKDALDLAKVVRALAERIPSPALSNPVAALVSATGPVQVEEDIDRARQYITLDLSVAGQPFI